MTEHCLPLLHLQLSWTPADAVSPADTRYPIVISMTGLIYDLMKVPLSKNQQHDLEVLIIQMRP